jgi:hypothetical protein
VRGTLRTGLIATAALAAAVAIYLVLTLPPASLRLTPAPAGTTVTVPGAYHIHTNRSDGTGSIDDVARAAARAGLGFVILTDHGDGTATPEPPAYRHGVLVLDAVELNSEDGHLVALGLPGAAPYPLAGPTRDVLEDVHRLGGLAIAAHPDSPRAGLRWRGAATPDRGLLLDGIEWLNADSEWRDETPSRLAAAAMRATLRPAESIATLFTRPVRTLRRWDDWLRTRPVVAIAAVDAHARIPWHEGEAPRWGTVIARPSYQTMFETLVQSVVLDRPLSERPEEAAAELLGSLRSGRTFSVVRAQAWPASLDFTGLTGAGTVVMGQTVVWESGRDLGLALRAAVPEAPGARIELLLDGRSVAASHGRLTHMARQPGAYRVEVTLPATKVPWIVSNPIRIAMSDAVAPEPAAGRTVEAGRWELFDPAVQRWAVEKSGTSSASLSADVPPGTARLQFALGSGPPSGQYAAMATPVGTEQSVDRVAFVGQSDKPRRISVQIRVGSRLERWRHSAYIDETPREITLRIQDFVPADRATTGLRPNAVPLGALLFVIDTVNAAPGAAGAVTVSNIRFGLADLRQPAP